MLQLTFFPAIFRHKKNTNRKNTHLGYIQPRYLVCLDLIIASVFKTLTRHEYRLALILAACLHIFRIYQSHITLGHLSLDTCINKFTKIFKLKSLLIMLFYVSSANSLKCTHGYIRFFLYKLTNNKA